MNKFIQLFGITVFLILILIFGLNKQTDATIALAGLIIAFLSLPYFTLDIELKKHRQLLAFEERKNEAKFLVKKLDKIFSPLMQIIISLTDKNPSTKEMEKNISTIREINIILDDLISHILYYKVIFPQKLFDELANHLGTIQKTLTLVEKSCSNFTPVSVEIKERFEKEYRDFFEDIRIFFKEAYYNDK